ncbi:CoA transferase [Alicyclobacillus tolerans]|uniref:CaiB/BaiF CoA transferase family protein n=1 Tax=Alicyclobacillus tolerans TaxID=90970 RepID=UPI001F404517|nr:CoA transferase [Alicyclobacillus tolerans]MCF8567830.1 CoA transferase [Alicyclobacillus tolerans]
MSALKGVRVLDVSTVIAAPFASGLMADFGADVIKVEKPVGGDPFRTLGPYYEGESIRWASMGRNKRCVTLDLHRAEGKALFLKLIAKSDVLIENFRTGTLDKWGLDVKTIREANPEIIITRVTGYGQTGPDAEVPGFGTPATAFSGMTYITGYPDRPPVSPSFSLVDYVTGLYAVMSTMVALYNRDALKGKAQEIDVSLYEGIFRMMELMVADYHKNGVIKERTPSLAGSSSPGGTYQTLDGKWVVMVCSTDRTFEYLTRAMDRSDLLENPLYSTMKARLENNEELDAIVQNWFRSMEYHELKQIADREGVPVSLVYSVEDIFNDPHYAARENIVEMDHPTLGTIKMPGIVPKFSETPGQVKWIGPKLGEHNEEVFTELLGLNPCQIEELQSKGII